LECLSVHIIYVMSKKRQDDEIEGPGETDELGAPSVSPDPFAFAGTSATSIHSPFAGGKFAVAGTDTIPEFDAELASVEWVGGPVEANFQLRAWRDAKREYRSLVNGTATNKIETSWSLINQLGLSLVTLFGMSLSGDHTPSLRALLNETLPQRGLCLSEEEPEIYAEVKELAELYEPGKHLNRTKAKRLTNVSMERLSRMIEAVRCTWHWYVQRSNYSPLNSEEFGERYCNIATNTEY